VEHSTLHALQLLGLILAVGGPILMLGLFAPAYRALGAAAKGFAAAELPRSVTRWTARGALIAAVAAFLDLFVQVAELDGLTVFGGVDFATVVRFATTTTVGQLVVLRIAVLLLTAAATLLPSSVRWWVALLLACGSVLCSSLVSHAAAQPSGRSVAIALQALHILGGGAWMGTLFHLFLSRRVLQQAQPQADLALVAAVLRRFAPIALSAAGLIAVSGAISAVRYVGPPAGLLFSAYGLTLLVKMMLLLPIFYAGFTNFRLIAPGLAAAQRADQGRAQDLLRRFGRTLELEVTAGVLVVAVAGIVGSVSPPGEDGSARLSQPQIAALLSPDFPTTVLVDPEQFVDSPERNIFDLQYSELMHNWSGMVVIVMGMCWLLQSLGGRGAVVATRIWPFLLLPFAAFISIFADPEVFVLRRVTFREAVSDPVVLEHQIGALMVVILAWMARRDRHRPPLEQPLGYPLPVLMIIGSLLLLGHAHSSVRADEALGNLINAQHAVLGALGLLAGVIRWLMLRQLIPAAPARIAWPALIIGLGVFMAFGYREVV
jgi:putative copper export protein